MLTGENGILTQAQRAKNETENAAANEVNILGNYEDSINEITGDVPQVNDSNPGVLEGTGEEENPYTINSIEDLVAFADSVTNGNTYQGQYVKLNQSLDFKSDKSYVDPSRENYYGYTGKLKEALSTGEGFKPIGTVMVKDGIDTTDSFCGYFDGNGKQIINCFINVDTSDFENDSRFSFFGSILFGEIKNLGLTKVNYNLVANGQTTGISGIIYTLASGGKIENCYITGNITATQKGNADIYSLGLTGMNRGTIENCYNLANISAKSKSDESGYFCYCAGIVSNNEIEETATIRNCYNAGTITAETNVGTIQIGGIASLQTNGIIEKCYNIGEINCNGNENTKGKFCYVGGIIGNNKDNGKARNIYNLGNINVNLNCEGKNVGGIIGYCNANVSNSYNLGTIKNLGQSTNAIGEILGNALENAVASNLFYINNEPIGNNLSSECETIKVTNAQLKSDEILNLLNQDGVVWKKDTSNINNGYPIFTWQ